jgi:hypothetical protein
MLKIQVVTNLEFDNPPPEYIVNIDVTECLYIPRKMIVEEYEYKLDYLDTVNNFALYSLEDEVEQLPAKA